MGGACVAAGPLMLWVKGLHLAAIAFWVAGLVCLPGLYLRRTRVRDRDSFHRLHALVRFLYVGIVSPAAFLAVASGTALVFLRQTFDVWFFLKLAFVAVLVVLHVLAGTVIVSLFRRGRTYPLWRRIVAVTAVLLASGAILLLVLAKPDLAGLLPAILYEPGGLRRLAGALNLLPR